MFDKPLTPSGQLSVTVGAVRVVVPVQRPDVLLIVTLLAQVMTGGMLSTTVTVNVQFVVETLPTASTAFKTTVVVPFEKEIALLAEPFVKPVKLVGLPFAFPENVAFQVNGPLQLSASVGAGIG